MDDVLGIQFKKIKKIYQNYSDSLLKQGKFSFRPTEKGYWGISIIDDLYGLFTKIKLQNFKNFIDLGSGDGRVANLASLFTKSTGIEFDAELSEVAHKFRDELKLSTLFSKADYMHIDLSVFDIVFCFPDEPISRKLESKLEKELKGRLIVYAPEIFHPRNLKKVDEVNIDENIFVIYSNPNIS